MRTILNTLLMHISMPFFIICFPYFLFASTLLPGFQEVKIADGLDPVAMAMAPDGRLFLVEKSGRISIVENGQLRSEPFMEIAVDNWNERGLSGIAIDPGFEQNYFLYIYYTVPGEGHNRVSRLTADGNFAAPGSETVLLNLDPLSGGHHNAGAMVFGADGKLYIAVGEGTNIANSQSMSSLLGKILRLNPDGTIPEDNPFYEELDGNYRAIWALGLRNPFAMHAEPGTGRIFVTDVGSDIAEEINEIFKGKNYGYPLIEGYLNGQTPPTDYQDPLLAYNRDLGCAAVGVTTYKPANPTFPSEYWDKIFFTDYCRNSIRTLDPQTGQLKDFAKQLNRPLNLVVGPDGTLYFLSRAGAGGGSDEDNTASDNGSLWRIFYTGSNAPFISVQPQSLLVPQDEEVPFVVLASGAPPLLYQWQQNGVDIPGANEASFVFPNSVLSDSGSVFRCIVTNALGADTSQNAVLMVTTNSRPSPVILFPQAGTVYRAGDAITFFGKAWDAEEGWLPVSNFRWRISFVHDTHAHPAWGPASGKSGDTFVVPKISEVDDHVYYEIIFTATDENGLSQTAKRSVMPVKTDVFLKTYPPGFPVFVHGNLRETPAAVHSVVGIVHEIQAPRSHIFNDTLFVFKQWSNGDLSNHLLFEAPETPVVLTAVYEAVKRVGHGTGLQALYFDDVDKNNEFNEMPVFTRVDSVIYFKWDNEGPDVPGVTHDNFLVRWQGFIQPFFDDTLHFHLASDDGTRLWVDSVLVIDEWRGHALAEFSGSIFLKADTLYPFQVEYFEGVGAAVCQLFWSSGNVARSVVPQTQLYPFFEEEEEEPGDTMMVVKAFNLRASPNPFSTFLKVLVETPQPDELAFVLHNAIGQRVFEKKEMVGTGSSLLYFDLADLPKGIYFLTVEGGFGERLMKFVKE